MASKKSKPKNKHYPVVLNSPISAGASANTLVDTARFLSVMNRRLYRFGRYYQTKVDLRNDYVGQVEVFALRDDWAVQKAFQMAYEQYEKNTTEERKNLSTTQVARWEDFRVASGVTLAINQARPVLHTIAGAASVLNAGEFELSTVIDGADARRTFTWGTPGGTEWGILQEYDKAGNAPTTPTDTVGSSGQRGPYSGIDADTDDAMALDLQQHGDDPPYDRTGVNATSPWVRIGVLGNTAGTQKLSTGFFNAPCGLVLLKGYSETSEAYSATLCVKAGDYKGVHAPSMLE